MKKLIILVSLIALLASGMVFAQVTVSGQIEYGVLTDFDNAPGQHWDNTLTFNAKIDEFNTGIVRFRARRSVDANYANPGIESSDAPLIDKFAVTTNVLGALGVKGVPVKWMSTNGMEFFSTMNPTDGVSPYAMSRVSRIWGGLRQFGLLNRFTFSDMFTVGAAIFPNQWDDSPVDSDGNGGYWLEAYTTLPVGPGSLTAVLNYGSGAANFNSGMVNGDAFDKSDITGGVKYLMPMGDLKLGFAGNFRVDLDSDAAVGYYYGAAASIEAAMFKVSGGFVGFEESAFNAAEFQVLLRPAKGFAIEIGGVLAFDDEATVVYKGVGKDVLNELDVNAQINLGKNLVRVGYLVVSEDNLAGSLLNGELSRIGRGSSFVEKGGMYFEVSVPY
jgi:hypothetical protein